VSSFLHIFIFYIFFTIGGIPLLSILIPNTLLASPELAPTPKLIWLHQSTRQRVKTSSKLFSYLFSLILYVSCILPLSILLELITFPDLLHIYSTPLPQTSRVLSTTRGSDTNFKYTPLIHPSLS
jgi:hypothetical protein